jgi:hypothetical protein
MQVIQIVFGMNEQLSISCRGKSFVLRYGITINKSTVNAKVNRGDMKVLQYASVKTESDKAGLTSFIATDQKLMTTFTTCRPFSVQFPTNILDRDLPKILDLIRNSVCKARSSEFT